MLLILYHRHLFFVTLKCNVVLCILYIIQTRCQSYIRARWRSAYHRRTFGELTFHMLRKNHHTVEKTEAWNYSVPIRILFS